MTELWTNADPGALPPREPWWARDVLRPILYAGGILLYTFGLAWSAYDLGVTDTRASCIVEPPATVTRPSGRVP